MEAQGAGRVDEISFAVEVQRARKDFLDARTVSITDWHFRNRTEELLKEFGLVH